MSIFMFISQEKNIKIDVRVIIVGNASIIVLKHGLYFMYFRFEYFVFEFKYARVVSTVDLFIYFMKIDLAFRCLQEKCLDSVSIQPDTCIVFKISIHFPEKIDY